jgi:hypothetical protein
MKRQEIKLIQNCQLNYFRVVVNGKDVYEPFYYDNNDPDSETDVRRLAKAAAFDECCRTNNVSANYMINY